MGSSWGCHRCHLTSNSQGWELFILLKRWMSRASWDSVMGGIVPAVPLGLVLKLAVPCHCPLLSTW